MADQKISATTANAAPVGGDEVATNQAGSSVRTTLTQIGSVVAPAASDTVAGKIELAIQSEMETGTDVVRAVVPGRQHFHPSAAKCWLNTPPTGTTPSASYNITSLTDVAGSTVVTIGTDFSSANWVATITNRGGTTLTLAALGWCSAMAAGSVTLHNIDASATQVIEDPSGAFMFAGFGDHA